MLLLLVLRVLKVVLREVRLLLAQVRALARLQRRVCSVVGGQVSHLLLVLLVLLVERGPRRVRGAQRAPQRALQRALVGLLAHVRDQVGAGRRLLHRLVGVGELDGAQVRCRGATGRGAGRRRVEAGRAGAGRVGREVHLRAPIGCQGNDLLLAGLLVSQ